MAELPVPAKTFFGDFFLSLLPYEINRSGTAIATLRGMSNDDECGKHICLETEKNTLLKKVKVDSYRGTPELIKAYY